MASWFSHPIAWNRDNMTLLTDAENRMQVTTKPGRIDITALYDGFVVYRLTSTSSPERGNLELVLVPDKWPDAMQKHFNPDYPRVAVDSGITELPPGRVVYLNIARSDIQQALHKLILDNFHVWRNDRTKVHRTLDFIPDAGPTSLKTLKTRLLEAWDSGKTDGEKKIKVDAEISLALTEVLDKSVNDTLLHALPVQGSDILCSLGNSTSNVDVTFEIRNLYGEPLNPHFYLRKLERTLEELTPAPPFQTGDPPPPRFKEADKFLPIRIPKQGGVEFNLMTIGIPSYESKIIWSHQFDPSNGSHSTSLEPRPGETVEVPKLDPAVERRVNAIWDTDHFWINKHAEIFSVPCELILATIYKEARPFTDGTADMHSIRLEEVKKVGAYPTDYEELIDQSKTAGSLLTKDTIETFWKLVGLWATHERGLSYEPRKRTIKPEKFPDLSPEFPFDETVAVGTTALLQKITWEQLAEIVQLKPHLIKTKTMLLPLLGKTRSGQYHYDLIKDDADLGEDVARLYWDNVGGVRLNAGKEQPKSPAISPPKTLAAYPLPTNKDFQVFVDPNDATKVVTWEQLLLLLELLRTNRVKNVPEASYQLQPLRSEDNYSFSSLYAKPKLRAILGITDAQAQAILDRYFALMTKDVAYFPSVGPAPGAPGIKRAKNAVDAEYLTLTELRAMTQIYPGRVSIGVGQILFDTAARKVVPWIKKHYGDEFFTRDVSVPIPPATVDARISWLWDNLWDNEELQIAFIASYHKQNATMFWQAYEDNDDNKYKVGEMMTRFDFPRVAAAYNAGLVRKPRFNRDAQHPDVDWGLHTFGDYFAPTWAAMTFAVKRFDSIPTTDMKWARVRLRPDLETNSGMDTR